MNIDQIALQLYTIREHTQRDMLGTLRQVAEIGYRAVELAGYGNVSVPELRSTLDELGVRAVSAHVALQRFLDEPQQVLDELTTLGCEFAVVPFVAEDRRRPLAQARQLAADLNRVGAQVRAAGLGFAYHNHAFEFEPLETTTLWDVLVNETDPQVVNLELDACWAYVGGQDPTQIIQQLGSRLPLLHVKDWLDDQKIDAPVGDGSIQWQPILAAAEAAGVRYFVVEQDHPRDPMNDIRRSFQNLSQMA